jgi:hypothetical protein
MVAGPIPTLTQLEYEELYALYTTTLNGDLRIRCQMVMLARNGYTLENIAEITCFGEDSITECFQRYQERRLVGLRGLTRQLADAIDGDNELAGALTYQYQVLLGASRQRLQDSAILLEYRRYNGAMYVGSYAIECILKCYLCHRERKRNFLDTRVAERFRGARGHDLKGLLDAAELTVARARKTDRSGRLAQAFQVVYGLTAHTHYRYNETNGNRDEAERVVPAIRALHQYFENSL